MADAAPVPPPAPAPPVAAPAAAAGEGARLVRLALGFYAIVALFAFGYGAFTGRLPVLFGEEWPGAANWFAALVVGLGLVGLSHLAVRVSPLARRAVATLSGMLGPYEYRHAVVLALASGFAEELLFRGALWGHLGLLGTTLLFGLVHVLPRRDLLFYPAFAAGAGLLLGFLRQGSGSVLPPMLAHALVNGLNLAWFERRRRRAPAAPPP